MEIETQGGNVLAVNAVTAAPLPSAEVFVVRSVE
jgi:hypothetical protein